jgi:hypothetical protein
MLYIIKYNVCNFLSKLLIGVSVFIYIIFFTHETVAQSRLDMGRVDSLLHLTIFDTIDLEDRQKYFEDAKKLTLECLQQPNSFHLDLSHMNWVSVLYPQDSSFRIFTAQLNHMFVQYEYWGILQKNDGTLIELKDDITAYEDNFEYDSFDESAWYGALYYNIHQFESPKGRKYLLFGFRGIGPFKSRKFIDVLDFDHGQASFGAPVFKIERNGELFEMSRFKLDYAPKAVVSLNFDFAQGQIFFNHLITVNSGHPKAGLVNVPDGTFEVMKLENGLWRHYGTPIDLLSSEMFDRKKSDKR